MEEIKTLMGDRLKYNSKFVSNYSDFLMEEIAYSLGQSSINNGLDVYYINY